MVRGDEGEHSGKCKYRRADNIPHNKICLFPNNKQMRDSKFRRLTMSCKSLFLFTGAELAIGREGRRGERGKVGEEEEDAVACDPHHQADGNGRVTSQTRLPRPGKQSFPPTGR